MGNLESIPIVSQVKSIIQMAQGDEAGARETQHIFLRQGIIASQINSLVHAAHGNNEEARNIQIEQLENLQTFAESAPVIGHVAGGIYIAQGEEEKGKAVLLDATKSTVVLGAAILCSPGGPAAAAACAGSSNVAWDAGNSLATGKKEGIFGLIEDGNYVDAALGQGVVMGGAALGAKAGKSGGGKVLSRKGIGAGAAKSEMKISGLICRRSVEEEFPKISDTRLPMIEGVQALPSSLSETWGNMVDPVASTDQAIESFLTLFLIIKLMGLGHRQSKPYYDEVCGGKNTGFQNVEECSRILFSAINKYGEKAKKDSPNPGSDGFETGNETETEKETEIGNYFSVVSQMMDALLFELNEVEDHSQTGGGILLSLCSGKLKIDMSNDEEHLKICLAKAWDGVKKIEIQILRAKNWHDKRKKRSPVCSPKFKQHHTIPADDFVKSVKRINKGKEVNNLPQRNQWIKKNTVLNPNKVPAMIRNAKPVLDVNGSPVLLHNKLMLESMTKYIQHDKVLSKATYHKGNVRFTLNGEGKINHLTVPKGPKLPQSGAQAPGSGSNFAMFGVPVIDPTPKIESPIEANTELTESAVLVAEQISIDELDSEEGGSIDSAPESGLSVLDVSSQEEPKDSDPKDEASSDVLFEQKNQAESQNSDPSIQESELQELKDPKISESGDSNQEQVAKDLGPEVSAHDKLPSLELPESSLVRESGEIDFKLSQVLDDEKLLAQAA